MDLAAGDKLGRAERASFYESLWEELTQVVVERLFRKQPEPDATNR